MKWVEANQRDASKGFTLNQNIKPKENPAPALRQPGRKPCQLIESCVKPNPAAHRVQNVPLAAALMAFAASVVAACARYGQNPPATPAQGQITPEQLTRSALRFDACFLAMASRRGEKALQTMLQRPLFLTVLPYRSNRRDRLPAQQQVHHALINPAVIPHRLRP